MEFAIDVYIITLLKKFRSFSVRIFPIKKQTGSPNQYGKQPYSATIRLPCPKIIVVAKTMIPTKKNDISHRVILLIYLNPIKQMIIAATCFNIIIGADSEGNNHFRKMPSNNIKKK